MRRFWSRVLFFCIIFLLGGCGIKPREGTQEQEAPTDLWKQQGFQVSDQVKEETHLWVESFLPWEHANPISDPEHQSSYTVGYPDVKVYGEKLFRLNALYDSGEERLSWALEVFDTVTGVSSVSTITGEDLGLDEEVVSYLADMAVLDEEHFVFQIMGGERTPEGDYYQTICELIYYGPEGVSHRINLWSVCLEKGIVQDQYQSSVSTTMGSCVCDRWGNYYLAANDQGRGNTDLYVFDPEGATLLEYHGGRNDYVGSPLRTQTGEMIYGIYKGDERSYFFYLADTLEGCFRQLCELKGSQSIRQFLGMQGNTLYYQSSKGIVGWDVLSGQRKELLNFTENPVLKDKELCMILREGEAPLLRMYENGENKSWIVTLSPTPVEGREALRVTDLASWVPTVGVDTGHSQVSRCAALLTMEDPNEMVTYESSSKDPETLRNRILAELVAGEGPDIMYVSREDCEMLAQKGALLELTEVLSQETIEGFLPGAIRLGTVEGRLVGLPSTLFAEGMVVSREVWPYDSWGLEDVLDLIEEGKLEPLVYYSGADTYFWPLATARLLTTNNLENSFLIDWENCKGHFDDERYIRMLKNLNVDVASLELDPEHPLKGGRRMAFIELNSERSLPDFGLWQDRENGNMVGLPTRNGPGNWLSTPGLLVVNKNTKHPERVKAFFERFLSEEIQREIPYQKYAGFGVRGFSEDWITYTEDGKALLRGEELTVYENGETSLHRAQQFLQSCSAAPRQYEALDKILYEELEALFSQQREPDETARIINNRIQLYLDEQGE